jgi:hypothetical protein
LLVGPIAVIESGLPLGSTVRGRPATTALATRGQLPLPADTLLVVATSALRGDDDERWQRIVRDAAPTGGRLATTLVDTALRAGEPREDLLAVVVRAR